MVFCSLRILQQPFCARTPVYTHLPITVILLLFQSCDLTCTQYMCNTCLIFHTLLWCTVHTMICYTAGLHLRLQYHLPPATRCNLSGQDSFTQLHVYSLYSTGRGFIHWEGYCYLFPDDLRGPNICLHANARLWLPAFYSASKTLKQKPHTSVFPSHMVVIVYVPNGLQL
jgi:hypothetical protein